MMTRPALCSLSRCPDPRDLAAAEQGSGLRLGDGHDHAVHDLKIDGKRQTDRLFQPAFIGARRGGGNDVCILFSGLSSGPAR